MERRASRPMSCGQMPPNYFLKVALKERRFLTLSDQDPTPNPPSPPTAKSEPFSPHDESTLETVEEILETEVSLAKQFAPHRVLTMILATLPALGITLAILWFAPNIREFETYGYPGIFLSSLIGNASIALPIPSLAVTFAMGAVLNWVLVGLVSGVGEALGESTGYLAGYGGAAIVENQELYRRMQVWMASHGFITIFVLSVVPNPVIDLAGIAAGAARFGFGRFLFSCWLGKAIKTMLFAWAGSQSLTWLIQVWQ